MLKNQEQAFRLFHNRKQQNIFSITLGIGILCSKILTEDLTSGNPLTRSDLARVGSCFVKHGRRIGNNIDQVMVFYGLRQIIRILFVFQISTLQDFLRSLDEDLRFQC